MSVMSLEAIALALQDKQAREAEYAKYRAIGPIDIDGVRAFNVGDSVPVSHVERGIVPLDAVTSDEAEAQEAVRRSGQVALPRPADNASADAWRAFASQHPEVVPADDLSDMTRDELVARFPKEQ